MVSPRWGDLALGSQRILAYEPKNCLHVMDYAGAGADCIYCLEAVPWWLTTPASIPWRNWSGSRRTGDAWFAGSAVRWRVTDPVLFFAESYASKPTAPGVGSAVAMRLGGQYEFFKGISLNLAVGRGRNQGVVESLGLIGLTINR